MNPTYNEPKRDAATTPPESRFYLLDGDARARGVLSYFLQRSLLLTGLYLLIGNVFQQAYLRALGIKVDLIDPRHLFPSFTDLLVWLYVFGLWAVLASLPDRWYNHLAEVSNLSTWRAKRWVALKVGGIGLWYMAFFLTNVAQLSASGRAAVPLPEIFVPSLAFFSRWQTSIAFLATGLGVWAVYRAYTRIRRRGLLEVERQHVGFMRLVFHAGLPFVLCYALTTFGIALPATYGTLKVGEDLSRMRGSPLLRVSRIEATSLGCLPGAQPPAASGMPATFAGDRDGPEVHYVGEVGDWQVFVVMPKPPETLELSIYATVKDEVCLLSTKDIVSIQLDRPG